MKTEPSWETGSGSSKTHVIAARCLSRCIRSTNSARGGSFFCAFPHGRGAVDYKTGFIRKLTGSFYNMIFEPPGRQFSNPRFRRNAGMTEPKGGNLEKISSFIFTFCRRIAKCERGEAVQVCSCDNFVRRNGKDLDGDIRIRSGHVRHLGVRECSIHIFI
jgi:hypothetical protein